MHTHAHLQVSHEGIGRATAIAIVREGGKVGLVDQNEKGLLETQQLLQGARACMYACGCECVRCHLLLPMCEACVQ